MQHTVDLKEVESIHVSSILLSGPNREQKTKRLILSVLSGERIVNFIVEVPSDKKMTFFPGECIGEAVEFYNSL